MFPKKRTTKTNNNKIKKKKRKIKREKLPHLFKRIRKRIR